MEKEIEIRKKRVGLLLFVGMFLGVLFSCVGSLGIYQFMSTGSSYVNPFFSIFLYLLGSAFLIMLWIILRSLNKKRIRG